VGGDAYNTISIRDSNGFVHNILHTQAQFVKPGQQVPAGQVIAAMGGVGAGEVQHVHYGMRDPTGARINPADYWSGKLGVTPPVLPAQPIPYLNESLVAGAGQSTPPPSNISVPGIPGIESLPSTLLPGGNPPAGAPPIPGAKGPASAAPTPSVGGKPLPQPSLDQWLIDHLHYNEPPQTLDGIPQQISYTPPGNTGSDSPPPSNISVDAQIGNEGLDGTTASPRSDAYPAGVGRGKDGRDRAATQRAIAGSGTTAARRPASAIPPQPAPIFAPQPAVAPAAPPPAFAQIPAMQALPIFAPQRKPIDLSVLGTMLVNRAPIFPDQG
jgi:Peptidase family M23